jgi:uncharacterized membrane protein
MNLQRAILGCSSALLLGGTAAAQSYTVVPGAYSCSDVTPDGELVVGSGSGGAYYWRWRTDPAPTYVGGSTATGVSNDGTVITGNMKDPATNKQVAGRWTQATGWVPLGALNGSCGSISSAYGIDGSGNKLVGLGWNSCSGQGYLYTEGGTPNPMQGLEMLWNGNNRTSAISDDGTVAAGFAQGNFNRTPAWWKTDTLLGTVPDPDDVGEYYGVSADGSVLLGGRNGDGFYETWDAAQSTYVPTVIGGLNPGWGTAPNGISDSGGTIIGFDFQGLGTEAWVWNSISGIVGLQARLTSLGVANVPYMGFCQAISKDGKVVVGGTSFGDAWIAEIPPGPIATPYGCGFNNPPESLTHTAGASSIGSQIQLGVDDPTGSMVAPAFGFVSYSVQPAPNFPCGVPLPGFAMFGPVADLLISVAAPNPILTQISPALWTTPTQPVTVNLAIPFDLNLFGVDLYAQGALFSPSTSKIGLTNGMRITIGLF